MNSGFKVKGVCAESSPQSSQTTEWTGSPFIKKEMVIAHFLCLLILGPASNVVLHCLGCYYSIILTACQISQGKNYSGWSKCL